MSDYRVNFPVTGLALALEGLDALRAEMGLPEGALPGSALGDPRNANGDVAMPRGVDDTAEPITTDAVWIGRPGTAASSYMDFDGKTVESPARGDPSRYYMHIRTDKDAPGFDPSNYGLEPTDPATSAAVLGVWAGDEVPPARGGRR